LNVTSRAVAVAHGEAADLGRRRQVGLHQRRREQLRVGDVVEVGAPGIERQVGAGVNVQR
jgi:hypothetical protein